MAFTHLCIYNASTHIAKYSNYRQSSALQLLSILTPCTDTQEAGLNKWSVCLCVSHKHLGWLQQNRAILAVVLPLRRPDRSQKASSSLQTTCCDRPKACGNISTLRNQHFCIQPHAVSAPLCTGVIYTLPLSSPNPTHPTRTRTHTDSLNEVGKSICCSC